ncbi:MAG: hypothetical protein SV760_06380, partial [Halobacteria archaeon]|nr:hypothetical protein [Halobacteria archaeon]
MKTKTVAAVCVAAVVILSGCMGPSTGDGNQTGTGDSPPGISNGQVQNVTVLLESFRETLNGSYTANISIQSRSRRGSRQITGYVKKGS